VIVPAEDFDFNANLQKFDKEKLLSGAEAAAPKLEVYEKDDFFDSMSCEALERLALADQEVRTHPHTSLSNTTHRTARVVVVATWVPSDDHPVHSAAVYSYAHRLLRARG